MESKTADRSAAAGEPTAPEPLPGSSIPPEELEQLTADIVAALKTVYDPEIPADIYELGLIYKIDVDDDRNIAVKVTLTFDPPWDKDRMSDEAKLALGMF